MRFCCAGAFAASLALSGPVAALNIDLPGEATLTREVDRDADTYFLPMAAFSDGMVPSQELEGRVVRQAWRIEAGDLSTLGLLSAIRDQLQSQGYQVLLDCTAQECGGFDFRFGIDVLPAPDMFVDLFDYRFLSGQNPDVPGAQYVSALISRAGGSGYVQLVLVGSEGTPVVAIPMPEPTAAPEPSQTPSPAAEEQSIEAALVAHGHVILPDLIFATGSSALEAGSYPSLSDLAAFLKANPDSRVVLVGHTDAVGALDDNVALSRARAASVLERLVEDYGASSSQVSSDGMGYLSPVAPNATAEGRRANRRVEAVLLNTR